MSRLLFTTSTTHDGNMSFRFGGAPEVVENRRRFLEKCGGDYQMCLPMACNHGEIITPIDWNTHERHFGATQPMDQLAAEVLVTQETNLTLMLPTADCLPTAFYDPVEEVIALAHLNRKTITHDLGQKTVQFLTKHFGSQPENLLVYIGPHIKRASYAFTLPLQTPLPAQLKAHAVEKSGEVQIDLPGAEIAQLSAVGVSEKNITVSPIDTFASPEHFSHYASTRDTTKLPGRMATILMLTSL